MKDPDPACKNLIKFYCKYLGRIRFSLVKKRIRILVVKLRELDPSCKNNGFGSLNGSGCCELKTKDTYPAYKNEGSGSCL